MRKVQEVNDPRQAAQANDTEVKAFVANVEAPKQNVKPKQVVDAKAAKAKQAQGADATANAGGAAAGPGGVAAAERELQGRRVRQDPCRLSRRQRAQASGKPADGKTTGSAAADADKAG